jgi:hypothetical protein
MKIFILTSLLSSLALAGPHFSEGVMGNGIEWQARFNMPDCDHEGQKLGAWCLDADKKEARIKSGIENQLKEWMRRDDVKAIYASYLSFSNYYIMDKLCEVSKDREVEVDGVKKIIPGKKVQIYVDSATTYALKNNDKCGPKFNVSLRGKGPYGSEGAHLQHMKIFVASPTEELPLLAGRTPGERAELGQLKLRWTSSSANMSGYGTNLHFENWLFFTGDVAKHTAQKNLCVFKAFAAIEEGDYRQQFSDVFNACVAQITAPYDKDIRMFVVPNTKRSENPYFSGLKNLLYRAQTSLKVAIHRLISNAVVGPIIYAHDKKKLDVKVLLDDDSMLIANGQGGFDMHGGDARTYERLQAANVNVGLIETNAQAKPGKGHLFHNKFVIADDKALFQGAGNFTGAALNISGSSKTRFGNYEQYYVIKDQGVVDAYIKAFEELSQRSTDPQDHPLK